MLDLAFSSHSVGAFKNSIANAMEKFTGHTGVAVRFNGFILEIGCQFGMMLIYDLRNYRELFGSLGKLGMTIEDISRIRRGVTAIAYRIAAVYRKEK